MDLSSPANIFGILTGIISVMIWTIKTYQWSQTRLQEINQVSHSVKELAQQLLSKATTAEKRADIHTYIQLRAIEFQGRRTRATVIFVAYAFFFAVLLFGIPYLISISSSLLSSILIVATSIFTFIAFLVLLVLERNLRKLEDKWQAGVSDSLGVRIDRHLSN